jgi:RNA-directed DNA polymerase
MKEHDEEKVIGFEALYTSMLKCRRGVMWKDSTAHFVLNGIEECLRLERQLKDGSYKPRPSKKVHITHPKPREAISIAFRDRVYQRSLNDNEIYPAMNRSFIYANMSCQKGKGPDKARKLLEKYLKRAYRLYGTDFHAAQFDIKG